MDSVLAYGLAWQGDADLVLVAPTELVGPNSVTALRLTCIATPVRLFGYETPESDLSAVPLPSPQEARTALVMRTDDRRRSFQLRDQDKYELVRELTAWADSEAPRLADRSRSSYRSWQYRASPVLKVRPARANMEIDAGSKKILGSPGESRRYVITTKSELASEMDSIRSDVEAAIEKIGAGVGRPDVEHRLQFNLVPDPDQPSPLSRALRLTYAAREFPAWRGVADHPTSSPGLIDFLGIDKDGRLHVVETKANADDPKIVLQTLDYALWIEANLDRVKRHPKFATATTGFPVLDFVCAPKRTGQRAIGPYMARQLDALTYEQRAWRICLVENPDNPQPTCERIGVIPPRAIGCQLCTYRATVGAAGPG
jgi:hypothetical protein